MNNFSTLRLWDNQTSITHYNPSSANNTPSSNRLMITALYGLDCNVTKLQVTSFPSAVVPSKYYNFFDSLCLCFFYLLFPPSFFYNVTRLTYCFYVQKMALCVSCDIIAMSSVAIFPVLTIFASFLGRLTVLQFSHEINSFS